MKTKVAVIVAAFVMALFAVVMVDTVDTPTAFAGQEAISGYDSDSNNSGSSSSGGAGRHGDDSADSSGSYNAYAFCDDDLGVYEQDPECD